MADPSKAPTSNEIGDRAFQYSVIESEGTQFDFGIRIQKSHKRKRSLLRQLIQCDEVRQDHPADQIAEMVNALIIVYVGMATKDTDKNALLKAYRDKTKDNNPAPEILFVNKNSLWGQVACILQG